jgi:hypothetical protein
MSEIGAHDTAKASLVTDHLFESKGEWWDLCKHCNLSEAAHRPPDIERKTIESETDIEDSPHWLGRSCQTCGKQLITTGNYIICSGCSKLTRIE